MIYNSKQIHNDFYFKNSNEREKGRKPNYLPSN